MEKSARWFESLLTLETPQPVRSDLDRSNVTNVSVEPQAGSTGAGNWSGDVQTGRVSTFPPLTRLLGGNSVHWSRVGHVRGSQPYSHSVAVGDLLLERLAPAAGGVRWSLFCRVVRNDGK